MISFDEAYKLTIESISPLGVETVGSLLFQLLHLNNFALRNQILSFWNL